MLKGIIFDMDGLLLDSEVVYYHIFKDLLASYGYELTLEQYAVHYSGHTGVDNITEIIHTYRLPITVEEGLAINAKRKEYYFSLPVDLKEGALELLQYLKEHDYKVVLATSSTKERAMDQLEKHHITQYFDEMVFGPELERGKPYPDIFLKAADKIGILPEEALVLEDSEAGVQAAYSGHIPVICVPDVKYPSQEFVDKSNYVLTSLKEVISLIENKAI